MNNAMIGPDSPIEIRVGSSYQARAMYPVPDGPLIPLKAKVAWSIEPAVKGLSIDSAGNISVAPDVLAQAFPPSNYISNHPETAASAFI